MKISTNTKKIISFFSLLGLFALPMIVGAQFNPIQGNEGTNLATTSVYEIIRTVMNWLLLILTVLAVIGFIISGLMFIIGDSDEKKGKAKSWLTFSIVGVVVALIGYIAINLIDTLLRGEVQN